MQDAAINILVQNGLTGVLIGAVLVYVWYRETKTIPKMIDVFKEEMHAERARCDKHHEEMLLRVEHVKEDGRRLHGITRNEIKTLAAAANLKQALDSERERHERDGD